MAVIDSTDLASRLETKIRALVSNDDDHFTAEELAVYQAIAEAIVEHLSDRDVEITDVQGTAGGSGFVFSSGTARIAAGT